MIASEELLQNDLFYVGWDVKPWLNQSIIDWYVGVLTQIWNHSQPWYPLTLSSLVLTMLPTL